MRCRPTSLIRVAPGGRRHGGLVEGPPDLFRTVGVRAERQRDAESAGLGEKPGRRVGFADRLAQPGGVELQGGAGLPYRAQRPRRGRRYGLRVVRPVAELLGLIEMPDDVEEAGGRGALHVLEALEAVSYTHLTL